MTFDGKAFGQEIVKEVKSFISKELAPINKRLDELEKRVDSLPAQRDGKDVDMSEVRSIISDELKSISDTLNAIQSASELPDIPKMINEAITAHTDIDEMERTIEKVVRSVVAEIPIPKDGKDGENGLDGISVVLEDVLPALQKQVDAHLSAIPVPQDGKSVTIEDVTPLIQSEIEKRISELPKPKDGKDGTSVTADDVMPALQKQVDAHLSAIPVPQDGKSVTIEDVTPLIQSEVEKRISEIPKPKDGKDGRDGLDVKDLFRGEGGVLVATMSDGRVKELGQFVGKDGADGVGFDDLSVDYDGEKTVTLRFTNGENIKEFPLVLPVVIDRGVFSEGKTYSAGDGVTWGGSFWIAQNETGEKPDTAKGWRLAVKKGRDGKDAKSAPAVNSDPIRVTIPKAGE